MGLVVVLFWWVVWFDAYGLGLLVLLLYLMHDLRVWCLLVFWVLCFIVSGGLCAFVCAVCCLVWLLALLLLVVCLILLVMVVLFRLVCWCLLIAFFA